MGSVKRTVYYRQVASREDGRPEITAVQIVPPLAEMAIAGLTDALLERRRFREYTEAVTGKVRVVRQDEDGTVLTINHHGWYYAAPAGKSSEAMATYVAQLLDPVGMQGYEVVEHNPDTQDQA